MFTFPSPQRGEGTGVRRQFESVRYLISSQLPSSPAGARGEYFFFDNRTLPRGEGDAKTERAKLADVFKFMSIDLSLLARPEWFAKLTLQDLPCSPFG